MDIKLEADDSFIDTTLLCRGCLASSGEMKNMSEWGLSEDFYRTTNIQVTNTEGMSQLLCASCEEMLVRCKRWTAQCRESDCYLRNTAKKKLELSAAANLKDEENYKRNTTSCLLFDNNLVVTIMAPDTEARIHLPCPHGCRETFPKKSDLHQHMMKTHQVDASFSVNLQYYCSVETCPYYISSGKSKFFAGRKFLNQHANKVHGVKFPCDVCDMRFPTKSDYNRHLSTCNFTYECSVCSARYKSNEKLLVHLLRRHPALHRQYKDERRAKRKGQTASERKHNMRTDPESYDYACDSPKRSFATQTLDNIKNDVSLSSWTKRDEISTQTVFEDLLSLKSSEDESIFYSETVSLSDIQTQTLEFGLSRSNKETITSGTQSPDLSLKGTQTCLCLYDSPRSNRFADSATSSPGMNFTSTETQTADFKDTMADLMSFSSIETQTSFDELKDL